MAGPNPYRLHSFRELRAVMGRAYVMCRPCRRFVGVGAWLDAFDTRFVTFTVCGGAGELIVDDPAREGSQHDLRPNPPRHPIVAIRLHHQERLRDPFGHRATAREMLPQRERPRTVPEPRYRLKPMPFGTFGDLAPLGLVLEVWCSNCKSSRPVAVSGSLAARPFGRGRFTCSAQRHDGAVCRGLGHRGAQARLSLDARPGAIGRSALEANVIGARRAAGRCGQFFMVSRSLAGRGIISDAPPAMTPS